MSRLRLASSLAKAGAPISLPDLRIIVNRDDENKHDDLVAISAIDFTERRTVAMTICGVRNEFSLNDHSALQLAQRAKIPAKFLKTLPTTGKGSWKDMLEARLQPQSADSLFIRVRMAPVNDNVAGVVRAILPNDYAPFDNRHLLDWIERDELTKHLELVGQSGTNPKSLNDGLMVRMVKSSRVAILGDDHKVGFSATARETGGNTEMGALAWRLVCSNGLMGWGEAEMARFRHTGYTRAGELHAGLHVSAHSALSQEEATVGLLTEKLSQPVNNIVSALRAAAKFVGLDQEQTSMVFDHFERNAPGQGVTRYHLLQSFTAVAKKFPLDTQLRVEERVGAHFTDSKVRRAGLFDTAGDDLTDSGD